VPDLVRPGQPLEQTGGHPVVRVGNDRNTVHFPGVADASET
jgi:hypothetical protein